MLTWKCVILFGEREVTMRIETILLMKNLACGEYTLVVNGRYAYLFGQSKESARKRKKSLLESVRVEERLLYELSAAHRTRLETAEPPAPEHYEKAA
jgi:hypothetical protein